MREEIQTQDYVSKFYAKRYSGNGLLYHKWVGEKMFPLHMPLNEMRVLDVGCGTGFMQEYERLYPWMKIYGVDASQGMLEQNPYKDRIFLGDAQRLDRDFRSGDFDHVICRALLHHLQKPKDALFGMNHVLKEGGTAYFLETNSSIINRLPRHLLKYTKRFSKDHKNFEFKELTELISEFFEIQSVEFIGYLAYPLVGFPDFINLPIHERVASWLIKVDDRVSKTFLKRLAFNVLIKARKKYYS